MSLNLITNVFTSIFSWPKYLVYIFIHILLTTNIPIRLHLSILLFNKIIHCTAYFQMNIYDRDMNDIQVILLCLAYALIEKRGIWQTNYVKNPKLLNVLISHIPNSIFANHVQFLIRCLIALI